MADYDYLPASNGSGDPALMHVTAPRLVSSTTLEVDSVTNVPTKFIATVGDLLASGFIDPATKTEFKGHPDSGNLIIDALEPGSTDVGNTEGQVVVIRPATGWANRVASFIKNMTNLGTPEDVTVDDLTASTVTTTGNATIGGQATVDGNLIINGTSHVASASVASGSSITPTAQVYNVTALAAACTINVPSFTAFDGMTMVIRIKDNGTARALTFASGYTNVSGLDTPTTTIISKELTIGAMYNSSASKWEIQSINQSA